MTIDQVKQHIAKAAEHTREQWQADPWTIEKECATWN